jgi:hypothetical protein
VCSTGPGDGTGPRLFAAEFPGREILQRLSLHARRSTSYTVCLDRFKRQLAYDGDGRLTQETWYAANGSVTDTRTFGYDEAGNLLAASNSAGLHRLDQ